MPRISLIDVQSTAFAIDSGNWETIHDWCDEWLPLLQAEGMPVHIIIQPLFWLDPDGTTNSPDWPANSRYFGPFQIPKEIVTGTQMDEWFKAERAWIENEIKGLTDE